MTPAAIVSKLWNYCNVLRDDGMSYGDYPSTSLRAGSKQLAYLLFLKMADERTKPPHNQPSAVPAKYNWPTLLKKDGDDLFDHYRHMLESLGKGFSPSPLNSSPSEGEELWRKTLSLEKGLLGLIFNKSQNKFQDPSKLRRQLFLNKANMYPPAVSVSDTSWQLPYRQHNMRCCMVTSKGLFG